MLTGFLSTALEIIIILDICGAIVYFALMGLHRSRGGGGTKAPNQVKPPTPTAPIGYPYQIGPSTIYGATGGTQEEKTFNDEPVLGMMSGLKQRLFSLKAKWISRPASKILVRKNPGVETDFRKLSQVLDSFKGEAGAPGY